MSAAKWRWIKPDVYPLIAALGLGCAFAVYSSVLNLTINPDVRVSRDRRTHDGAAEAPSMPGEGLAYKKNVYRKIGGLGSP